MENTEKQINLQGKIIALLNRNRKSSNLGEYEFSVSSQWGEDGIIQFLISKIPIKNKIFVEFGVESYREANTRFLLQNDNWSGLVIDGNEENINSVKNSEIYWRYSLTAISQFITKDNINGIITGAGISDDIGILSIDVDGNDYWIFEAIECISPRIVIIEYNSLFGKNLKISVPYDEKFMRIKRHYSGLYFGSSIAALTDLARKKGYCLIGSNSAGCNAFFVRKDAIGSLQELLPQNAYVKSKFRQSRDREGNLTFLNHSEGLDLIRDLEVVDFERVDNIKIGDLNI